MIHKASATARQAKLRAVYAGLAKTPKGRLTAESRAIWHSCCDGFNISPERARQIMKAPANSLSGDTAMTKDQRVKAMGKIITACQQIKDKKPLAEAVRKIVEDLQAEEKAHRIAAAAEEAANLAMKIDGAQGGSGGEKP